MAEQEVGEDGRVAALVGDVALVEQHHRQHVLEPAEVAEAEAAMADLEGSVGMFSVTTLVGLGARYALSWAAADRLAPSCLPLRPY